MTGSNRTGGIASLVASATFIFGIAMFATVMTDYTTGDPDAGESVTFLVDHQTPYLVWNVVIYIVFNRHIVDGITAGSVK